MKFEEALKDQYDAIIYKATRDCTEGQINELNRVLHLAYEDTHRSLPPSYSQLKELRKILWSYSFNSKEALEEYKRIKTFDMTVICFLRNFLGLQLRFLHRCILRALGWETEI